MTVYARSSDRSKLGYVWRNMKYRCYNPRNTRYQYYGGKGLVVCDEWLDFEVFYEWALDNGYDPSLTIDRLDSDVGYQPDNCVWHTGSANSRRAREKITCEIADQFRDLYGRFTYKQIGDMYGLSDNCVFKAVNRKTYRKGADRGNITIASN